MRDSTIIYRSFYESVKELPKKNQAEVWAAIFEFSLNFREIELNGISATIFKLIKPQLEANIKRYKNGSEAKRKQNGSKSLANVNVNDNVNVNVNVNADFEAWKQNFLKDELLIDSVCMQARISKSEFPEVVNKFFVTKKPIQNWANEFECKKHLINFSKFYTSNTQIISSPKIYKATDD